MRRQLPMEPQNDSRGRPRDACPGDAHLHLAVEGELGPAASRELARHLARCEPCRDRKRALVDEKLWILERAVRGPRLPARFARDITLRIQEECGRPQPSASTVRTVLPWAGAAASALALALLIGWTRQEPGSWTGPVPVPAPPARATGEPAREDSGVPGTRLELASVAAPLVATPSLSRAASSSSLFCSSENPGVLLHCPAVDPVAAALPGVASSRQPHAASRALLAGGLERSVAPIARADGRRGTVDASERRFEGLGRVVRLTVRLAVATEGTIPAARLVADPCPDDPNEDGKLNFTDVTYLCQELLQESTLDGALGHFAADATSGRGDDCDDEDCT